MMKTNSEIFDLVMERKVEYEAQKSARNKRIAAACVVIAIAVCVGIGVTAQKGRLPIKAGGESQPESSAVVPGGNGAEQTAVTRPDDPTDGEEAVIFPPHQSGEAAQTTKIYGGANVPEEDAARTRSGAPWKPDPDETTTATPKDDAGSYGGETQSLQRFKLQWVTSVK